jgi:hypothetical protein
MKNKNLKSNINFLILKQTTEKIFLAKLNKLNSIKKKLNSFKTFFFAVFSVTTSANKIKLPHYGLLYYNKSGK